DAVNSRRFPFRSPLRPAIMKGIRTYPPTSVPPRGAVMPVDTLPKFLQALRDSALLTPEQWAELKAFHAQSPDMRALARELVKRGWLSPYQVNQVVRGRGKDLVLGVYHLLEPLGEGGMGQVFKARHTRMKRVVALKIIRA